MDQELQRARPVLVSIRDEDGRIHNIIDHAQLIEHKEKFGMMPDVYFCFIIKSLIDDFGETLIEGSKGQVNKEQFEAQFIDNLSLILSNKTRDENESR